MKYFFFVPALLFAFSIKAQSDKQLLKDLRKSVYYLADDKLEGRRTGTAGEKKAYEFLEKKYSANGLEPLFNGSFIQTFEINEGVKLGDDNKIALGNNRYDKSEDVFALPYSKNGGFSILSMENGLTENIFLYDLSVLMAENSNNPHFDLEEEAYQKIKTISENKKHELILVYNSKNDSTADIKFDSRNKRATLSTIVLFSTNNFKQNLQRQISAENPFYGTISIVPNIRWGHNVSGWINNHAAQTIVLGAHYDHLGYGEDHNSLYSGTTPMIHNGADDNASGTGGLLALQKLLSTNNEKKFNYCFVSFSGEELGLYGSKYFTEHSPVDRNSVNYMVNMDMIGRLNDSTHGLTIGGFGTSPEWAKLININDAYFKIKVDSAGSGPSDHTSFYKKDIPVLFFFTGTHSDYHKPSDDADKINFEGELKIVRYIQSIISQTSSLEKLAFTKTKEAANSGKSTFKVSMGIMPDYTYSGNGVHVDGVSENKPAQKAGVKTGDVIYQLGDFIVSDVQSYMQALNKMIKGVPVKVKIKRGNEEIELTVTF